MSKSQNGNKENKKPKQVHAPNPPGLPPGLLPAPAVTPKPKKR